MIEDIVQKVAPGGRLLRTWPLKGGMMAEMTAVAFEDRDGRLRKLVVRRPSSVAEFQILQLAHSLGPAFSDPLPPASGRR